MREAVMHRHPDPLWQHTATYHKGDSLGKFTINGVYATPDLPFDAASWLQFMPHLGDHHFAVLDINSETLVGDSLLKIVRPAARRLSCSVPSTVAEYNKCLKTHMDRHQILPQLRQLYSTRNGKFNPPQQQQLEKLDRVRSEGMLFTEKKCRKLAMGNVDFSPEVDLAKKRRWLWRRLVADLLRQKRIPGANASVDVESCYDRITHAAGSLCAQTWDVSPNAIFAMLHPIQRMKYFLLTAFGDSEASFSSLDNVLAFQGSCQGNKEAPQH
jgi:hypothetical protein